MCIRDSGTYIRLYVSARVLAVFQNLLFPVLSIVRIVTVCVLLFILDWVLDVSAFSLLHVAVQHACTVCL